MLQASQVPYRYGKKLQMSVNKLYKTYTGIYFGLLQDGTHLLKHLQDADGNSVLTTAYVRLRVNIDAVPTKGALVMVRGLTLSSFTQAVNLTTICSRKKLSRISKGNHHEKAYLSPRPNYRLR